MTTRDNLDIGKLNEFRDFLEQNPDKGQLGLEARAVYEGQAGRSTVHIGPFSIDGETVDRETRRYTVPFGAWREVEELLGMAGPTDRMEPVEMALAATAACVVNSLTYNAARLGIDTTGLQVSVRENVDPRVLFALKDPGAHTSCLGSVEIAVTLEGEVTDEELDTLQQLAEYSPVYGLIAKANRVSHTVTRA